jgi:hypothetical protein
MIGDDVRSPKITQVTAALFASCNEHSPRRLAGRILRVVEPALDTDVTPLAVGKELHSPSDCSFWETDLL